MICQSCNGVIGRDCFSPEECMAITQDQAARYRDQSQAESNCEQCEAALNQLRAEFAEIIEMNAGMREGFSERIGNVINEVASVLQMLEELAELWGDEGKFRACRDRLRKLVTE